MTDFNISGDLSGGTGGTDTGANMFSNTSLANQGGYQSGGFGGYYGYGGNAMGGGNQGFSSSLQNLANNWANPSSPGFNQQAADVQAGQIGGLTDPTQNPNAPPSTGVMSPATPSPAAPNNQNMFAWMNPVSSAQAADKPTAGGFSNQQEQANYNQGIQMMKQGSSGDPNQQFRTGDQSYMNRYPGTGSPPSSTVSAAPAAATPAPAATPSAASSVAAMSAAGDPTGLMGSPTATGWPGGGGGGGGGATPVAGGATSTAPPTPNTGNQADSGATNWGDWNPGGGNQRGGQQGGQNNPMNLIQQLLRRAGLPPQLGQLAMQAIMAGMMGGRRGGRPGFPFRSGQGFPGSGRFPRRHGRPVQRWYGG